MQTGTDCHCWISVAWEARTSRSRLQSISSVVAQRKIIPSLWCAFMKWSRCTIQLPETLWRIESSLWWMLCRPISLAHVAFSASGTSLAMYVQSKTRKWFPAPPERRQESKRSKIYYMLGLYTDGRIHLRLPNIQGENARGSNEGIWCDIVLYEDLAPLEREINYMLGWWRTSLWKYHNKSFGGGYMEILEYRP